MHRAVLSHLISLTTPGLRSSRGFTIVELLIVVVVIAILAAITIVAYNGIQNRAKESASVSNAQQAGKKVTVYALSNNETLPATPAAAGLTNSGNVSYQYTLNETTNPNTFCITTTTSGTSVHVAGTSNSVNATVAGPCAGHSGTSPTTAASGACPTGYIVVPGSSLYNTQAFCVMKYEAKNVGGVATSQAADTPWVAAMTQTAAISSAAAACTGCHLITDAEWLTIAQNVISVPSNWSGGAVGSGWIYSGHSDNNPTGMLAASTDDSDGHNGTGQSGTSIQRRTLTLTNGEVIWDLSGNAYEWTNGTVSGGQPGISGYGWRNWSTIAGSGSLSPNPFPSYANPSAANWAASEGIGQAYSSSTETGLRGALRGAAYNSGNGAGVFSLNFNLSPGGSGAGISFRVAR